MYDAFYPGQVWLDTEGKRIQAHGGSVIYIDDTYYWYGENKEKFNGQFTVLHLEYGNLSAGASSGAQSIHRRR